LSVCNRQPKQGNCFIVEFEMASGTPLIDASLSATHVYMGYETGGAFTSWAELVPADVFGACHLTITGPFFLSGYSGNQLGGNPSCH